MTPRQPHSGLALRRGTLLLEVILALAIFVMAGTAILALVDRTIDGMHRTQGLRHAADLAASAMAQIEAGLATPQSLNGPVKAWTPEDQGTAGGPIGIDGAPVRGSGVLGAMPVDSGWELQIDTEPSQFHGLTRVTIKAVKRPLSGSMAAPTGNEGMSAGFDAATEVSYTLRQLVRLGGKGEDVAGGADSLADAAKKGVTEQLGGGPNTDAQRSRGSGSSGAPKGGRR